MKVPLHIVEARRRRLAEFLRQHAYATLQDVSAHFQTSAATARRDLAALAASNQIVRTYGGALAEYNQRFPSFHERKAAHAAAKRRVAEAARDLVRPGTLCFLDSGTTAFALAEALRRRPVPEVQIITNSLPTAELLVAVPGLRVHLLGGEILSRQSFLLGAAARKAVRFYSIHQAFLSAEAADGAGVWNSQGELVRLQRQVLAHADRSVLCLDRSKLGLRAPAFLAPWEKFHLVITDARAAALRGFPTGKRLLV